MPGWEHGYNFGVEENHPLLALLKENPQKGMLSEEFSFFNLSSPFVRLTALKKCDADNSLIIRLVEMRGVNQKIKLELFSPVKSLLKTNLIEEWGEDTDQSGKVLNLNIGKNSIETFKLKF